MTEDDVRSVCENAERWIASLAWADTEGYAAIDRVRAALNTRKAHTPVTTLTVCEHEIAEMLAQGMTQREIAAKRRCSANTVASHVARMGAKLPGPGKPLVAILRWYYTHRNP